MWLFSGTISSRKPMKIQALFVTLQENENWKESFLFWRPEGQWKPIASKKKQDYLGDEFDDQ